MALVRRYGSDYLYGFRLGVLWGWFVALDSAIGGLMLHDFLVKGSRGMELFQAISQEWAMSFYKVKHGEDAMIKTCEWIH